MISRILVDERQCERRSRQQPGLRPKTENDSNTMDIPDFHKKEDRGKYANDDWSADPLMGFHKINRVIN